MQTNEKNGIRNLFFGISTRQEDSVSNRKGFAFHFSANDDITFSRSPTDIAQFNGCLPILLRWKRSIYKLLWKHVIVYLTLYISLSLVYDYALNDHGRKGFEELCEYCKHYSRSINLAIMLGFFTSTAMSRLFTMQTTIPGTAKSITVFITTLNPNIPEGPFIVEQFARWHVLTWVLTFRQVCKPLAKIFPDAISLQAAGLLTEEETRVMESYERTEAIHKNTPQPLIVIEWLLLLIKETSLLERFRKHQYGKNVDLLMAFKKSCGNVIKFAKNNLPPQIMQAAIIAVYSFGFITLMGRSFTKEDWSLSNVVIFYFPILPTVQFFIYFAWLSFGIAAADPFGDDEDDIDVQSLFLSHVKDTMRLTKLYNKRIGDVFPNFAPRQNND